VIGAPYLQWHRSQDLLELVGIVGGKRRSVRHTPGCSGGRHNRSR